MLTMRPRPRAIMPSSTAWVAFRTPFRLIAITRSHSSGGPSTKRARVSQPALLTSASTGPSPASTASSAARSDARSVTSAVRPAARAPPATNSAVTAAADSPCTSSTPTAQPSRARARAIARPIPRPAPVTTATPGMPGLALRRHRGGERAGDGGLAPLRGGRDLAVDARLAGFLVPPRDPAAARDRVAGPDPGREAHLEAAQVAGPDDVGDAAGHEARRQHAVAEHRRIPRRLGEVLVVVDRVEVA